jgi:tRNA A-37 threonylcarbamoyl transferase component Bud32
MERFPSRKNKVSKVLLDGKELVEKVYAADRARLATTEYDVLLHCIREGVAVPEPVELRNGSIVMKLVAGDNLSALFERSEVRHERSATSSDALRDGLASWLASFHRSYGFRFCRGDCILRNFIMSGDRLYGLDFEEAHEGDPLEDIGQLWTSILRLRPSFTRERFAFASAVTRAYWKLTGAERADSLPLAVADGLDHYAPFGPDGPELRRWAEIIRRDGIGTLDQRRPDLEFDARKIEDDG